MDPNSYAVGFEDLTAEELLDMGIAPFEDEFNLDNWVRPASPFDDDPYHNMTQQQLEDIFRDDSPDRSVAGDEEPETVEHPVAEEVTVVAEQAEAGEELEIVGDPDTTVDDDSEQVGLFEELFGSEKDNEEEPVVISQSEFYNIKTVTSGGNPKPEITPSGVLQIDGPTTPPKKDNEQTTPQNPVTPPHQIGPFVSPSTYKSPYGSPASGSGPPTGAQFQPQAFFNYPAAGNPTQMYMGAQQGFVGNPMAYGNAFNGNYPASMMPTAYANGYAALQQGRPSPSFGNGYPGFIQGGSLGNGYSPQQNVPTSNYGYGYPGPQISTPSPNFGYSYPDPQSGNTPPGFSSRQAGQQQGRPSPNFDGAQPNTCKISPQSDNGHQLYGQPYKFNTSPPQNGNAGFQSSNASPPVNQPQGLGLPAEIVNNAPLSEAGLNQYLPNINKPRAAHECPLPIDPARIPEFAAIVNELNIPGASEQAKAMLNTVGNWEIEEVYIDPEKLRSASASMQRLNNNPAHIQARKDIQYFKTLVRDGKKAEADKYLEDMVAKLHGPDAMAVYLEHARMGTLARSHLGPNYQAEEDAVFPFQLRHGFCPIDPSDQSPEGCATRDKWFDNYKEKHLRIDAQETVIRKACHAYTRALIKHGDPRTIELPKVPLMPEHLRGELSSPDSPTTPKRGKRKSIGSNMEGSPSPMKRTRAPSRKRVVSQAAQVTPVAPVAPVTYVAPTTPIPAPAPAPALAPAPAPAGLEGTLNALTNAVQQLNARMMIMQGEMELIKSQK